MSDKDNESYLDAMASALSDIRQLARLDALMLRAELKSSVSEIGGLAVLGAVSIALAALGVGFLCVAGFFLLRDLGASSLVSALILAVGLLAVAGFLAASLLGRIGRWTIVPRRTIAQFQSNISTLRAGFSNAQRSS